MPRPAGHPGKGAPCCSRAREGCQRAPRPGFGRSQEEGHQQAKRRTGAGFGRHRARGAPFSRASAAPARAWKPSASTADPTTPGRCNRAMLAPSCAIASRCNTAGRRPPCPPPSELGGTKGLSPPAITTRSTAGGRRRSGRWPRCRRPPRNDPDQRQVDAQPVACHRADRLEPQHAGREGPPTAPRPAARRGSASARASTETAATQGGRIAGKADRERAGPSRPDGTHSADRQLSGDGDGKRNDVRTSRQTTRAAITTGSTIASGPLDAAAE